MSQIERLQCYGFSRGSKSHISCSWIFYSRKHEFFGLKASFIGFDALPQLFPHDHEEEERGAQALLAITHGEVCLWFAVLAVSSLLAALEKKIKVGGLPHLARATQLQISYGL